MQKKSLCADDLQMENDETIKIIEKYSPMVYRLAFSLVKSGSDADDIHQEVFVRYITNSPRFESGEHEKAWFLRVTANLCKNWWRTAWRRKVVSLSEYVGYDKEAPGCEGALSGEDSSLIAAVKKLPQKYRAVIHLFYYEEMPIEEIAGVLTLKPSTVRTQLTRARRKLSELLKEEI